MSVAADVSPSLHHLQAMADAIVPRGVVAVCRDADGDVTQLFAQEREAVEHAVAKRQAEFAAGRLAARAALQQLGQAPVAIMVQPDRSPLWPPGFTGSISHCRTAAVAVAQPMSLAVTHIGIDLEEATPLERELWESVCRPSEMDCLETRADATRWAKVIFSIKEAVYKAQYPLSQRIFDFQEVEITTLDPSGHFTAQLLAGELKSVSGRFRTNDQFVLAFAATSKPAA